MVAKASFQLLDPWKIAPFTTVSTLPYATKIPSFRKIPVLGLFSMQYCLYSLITFHCFGSKTGNQFRFFLFFHIFPKIVSPFSNQAYNSLYWSSHIAFSLEKLRAHDSYSRVIHWQGCQEWRQEDTHPNMIRFYSRDIDRCGILTLTENKVICNFCAHSYNFYHWPISKKGPCWCCHFVSFWPELFALRYKTVLTR